MGVSDLVNLSKIEKPALEAKSLQKEGSIALQSERNESSGDCILKYGLADCRQASWREGISN
jgi:hypothetical protein